jgi:hypothetical protein
LLPKASFHWSYVRTFERHQSGVCLILDLRSSSRSQPADSRQLSLVRPLAAAAANSSISWGIIDENRQDGVTVSRPQRLSRSIQSLQFAGSFVPQPNLPARIFLLRLLTAADDDCWATDEAVHELIDG